MNLYKKEFIYYIFLCAISLTLELCNPLFISLMVTYITDGKNALADYGINFWDFSQSDSNFLIWFTQPRQYGITLGIAVSILFFVK